MAQKLVVEGDNDIHLISHICLLKNIDHVVGYEEPVKYKNKFVTKAGGKEEVKRELKLLLKKGDESITNIGVVLDADSETKNPALDTWLSIRNILLEYGYENLPKKPNPQGTIIIQDNKTKIGVWIMPNNLNEGYLEHFFQELITKNDEFWLEAVQITEGFVNDKRNRFSKIALQKAKVHTWLSWQEKPELPMGLALKDYDLLFDLNKEIIQFFFEWFKNTFEVEMKHESINF